MRLLEHTLEIHLENGKPLSRENAQSSREVVAKAVIFPEKTRRRRMIRRTSVTAFEPVLLKRTR